MKKRRPFSPPPFIKMLEELSITAQKQEKTTLGQIFQTLSGRGYAAILILLTLPFCLPIQLPGVSTLFGLLIAYIGLRVALGKGIWWPDWILNKEIESSHLQKWVSKTIKIVRGIQKILHPRLVTLTQNYYFHRLHGLIIFVLALLLALPLPIPLTNLLCAYPLLFISIGLLEDDGLCILIGYVLTLVCLSVFSAIIIFGILSLKKMLF
jgi:hypothetical protein